MIKQITKSVPSTPYPNIVAPCNPFCGLIWISIVAAEWLDALQRSWGA